MSRRSYSEEHRWAAACWLHLTDAQAAEAQRRGTTRVDEHAAVVAIEIVCQACRRSYDDVHNQPCEAADASWREAHVTGGPTGHRRYFGTYKAETG